MDEIFVVGPKLLHDSRHLHQKFCQLYSFKGSLGLGYRGEQKRICAETHRDATSSTSRAQDEARSSSQQRQSLEQAAAFKPKAQTSER